MTSNLLIYKDEQGVEININKYRGIIESLLYLSASRSYIMFSVCMYARFHMSPWEFHFEIVKLILRYLDGTSHHGCWL